MNGPANRRIAARVPVWVGVGVATAARGANAQDYPMTYMRPMGAQADIIAPHIWGTTGISVAVVVIVAVLVLIGVLLKRLPRGTTALPVLGTAGGNAWVVVGTGLSTLVLLASVAWAAVVLASISAPSREPGLTIEVDGHQWWWEVTYTGSESAERFTTANEIHVPVGEPVRFKLRSADVIHSFWIPALGGKTDLIPGKINYAWLEANSPGLYRGQCAEYCGVQHARMALVLHADPPEEFETWRKHQLEEAPEPVNARVAEGQKLFMARCAICHTVRGTKAHGVVGPDLTHLMARETIAAGTLRNTTANLTAWVADPQGIKPGSKMPNLELSGPELSKIRLYLETLR